MPKINPWGGAAAAAHVVSDTLVDPQYPDEAWDCCLRRPTFPERCAMAEDSAARIALWEKGGKRYGRPDTGENVPLTAKLWQSLVALETLQCDAGGRALPSAERYSVEELIGFSVKREGLFIGALALLQSLNGDPGNASGTDGPPSSEPSAPTEAATPA